MSIIKKALQYKESFVTMPNRISARAVEALLGGGMGGAIGYRMSEGDDNVIKNTLLGSGLGALSSLGASSLYRGYLNKRYNKFYDSLHSLDKKNKEDLLNIYRDLFNEYRGKFPANSPLMEKHRNDLKSSLRQFKVNSKSTQKEHDSTLKEIAHSLFGI